MVQRSQRISGSVLTLVTRDWRTSPLVHVVVFVCMCVYHVHARLLVCAHSCVCVCLCQCVSVVVCAPSFMRAPLVLPLSFLSRAHARTRIHVECSVEQEAFVSHVGTTSRQISNKLLTCDLFRDLWCASCLPDTP